MEHTALIYVMVLTAAADSKMGDPELHMIGEIVRTLPVFEGYDPEMLPRTAEDCAEILAGKNGLDTVLKLVNDSLPAPLRETAYALACDVAAADNRITQEEARLLQMLRQSLGVDHLIGAAIERGARARFQRI